jgi:hypothetical protein
VATGGNALKVAQRLWRYNSVVHVPPRRAKLGRFDLTKRARSSAGVRGICGKRPRRAPACRSREHKGEVAMAIDWPLRKSCHPRSSTSLKSTGFHG